MLYGLLNPLIRGKIYRDQINDFREFIEAARKAEMSLQDNGALKPVTSNQNQKTKTVFLL